MKQLDSLDKGSGDSIKITYGGFLSISVLYLVIPIVIMIMTWLKLFIALPASLLLLGVTVLSIRTLKDTDCEFAFSIKKSHIIILAVLALFLTILFGVGEFVNTMDDHAYRRAMLRDLIERDWPLYYDLTEQSNPAINAYLPDCTVAFAYYLTYWMVPACLGKIAGFTAGNIMNVIWSAFGIFLVMLALCLYSKRFTWASVFTLVFFSGLDAIPYFVNMARNADTWLEGWTDHISFISNINDLLNTYNQCIPCWIITALIIMLPDNRFTGFIGALMFAYSPWATIGILPLALYRLLSNDRKIGRILSYGNLIVPAVLLICYAPMYMANTSSVSVKGSTIAFYGGFFPFIKAYFLVMLIEVIPYAIVLFGKHRKNGFLWVSVAVLAVLPFYKVSFYNDLTMRGAMPALFVFCMMLTGLIGEYFSLNFKNGHFAGKADIRTVCVALMLAVMAFVAFQQLLLVVVNTADKNAKDPKEAIGSFGDINDPDYAEQVNGNFFVYDYEDQFFYKYMARK